MKGENTNPRTLKCGKVRANVSPFPFQLILSMFSFPFLVVKKIYSTNIETTIGFKNGCLRFINITKSKKFYSQ